MKFGETGESIYSVSLPVQDGYKTPSYAYVDAVKILEAIDGTIIDTINFGAREHRTCEFSIVNLSRVNFYALMTYIEANLGNRIRVEFENAGERVFGEQLPGPVMYAYLTFAEPLGETGFSQGHILYGYALKMDYAGSTSTTVPNAADSCQYDFLISIDCVRATAGCTVANKAALDAVNGKPGGSRGLTTTDRKVYFYNSVKAIWEYQYTLPANDATQGLKNGVFRLSAFSDVSASSSGVGGEDWKSGWIVKRSINFPQYTVDARRGPAIEHLEGFSFAVENSAKRWKYPLDNNLAFYGAFCQLSVYDRVSGRLVLIRSGYNNRNSFDYTRLDFEVEPGIFLQNKAFPTTVIDKSTFPGADPSMFGKPVLATYGRWDKGQLQVINFTVTGQKLPGGRRYLGCVGYNASTKLLTVDIPSTELTKLLGLAAVSDYPGAAPVKYIYAQIVQQEGQPDINKLAKIDAITVVGGNTGLTLNKAFTKDADSTSIIQIYLSDVELIIDGGPTIGMRAPGYLVTAAEGVVNIPRQLYSKVNDTLGQVPDAYYAPVGTGENEITLNGQAINVDNFNTVTLKDSRELDRIPSAQVSGILCPGTVVTTYDFGFVPDGMKSEKIVKFPNDSTNGQTTAIASRDRITIAWSHRALGYSGEKYRLIRYKFSVTSNRFNPDYAQKYIDAIINIGASSNTFYVDTGLDPAFTYFYLLQVVNSSNLPLHGGVEQGFETGYKLDPKDSSGVNLKVKPGGGPSSDPGSDTEVTLIWNKLAGQRQVKIFRDGILIATLDTTTGTYLDATAYRIVNTGSESSHEYYIQVSTSNVGNNADRWYIPDGSTLSDLWSIQANTDATNLTKYVVLFDSIVSNGQMGYKVKTGIDNSGAGIPAAGVVFTWMMKVDRTKFPDLSNAKNVRLLTDFVTRSYYDTHTQVPIIIQLRAVKKDGKSFVIQQHSSANAGLESKEQARGAFAQFLNLPTNKSGLDANYDTEAQGTNANALYSGKDMWSFPDWLFTDNASEWAKVEYLMFAITNAVAITPEAAYKFGYHIGIGGLSADPIDFVKVHKDKYYVEYVKEFQGGLDSPQFGRIDGGRKDDASGTITGTPGKIIETARHVIDSVVYSMLGYIPVRVGNEMKNRDGWIWRWQTKETKPVLDTLQILANNIHGIFTLTPDDKLYLRSLDIDDPNNPPVFTFTDSNILFDSLGKPEYRKREEIYQKFRLKYNIEPSVGRPTEEMLIGWDLASSSPILSGYLNTVEDANGAAQPTGGDDGLADPLCRLSTQLFSAGLGINEFGEALTNERIYEMFYRPTTLSSLDGKPVERTLPNLTTLWGVGVKPPKRAMQELAAMVVKFFCYDSWYFPLSCSMKNVIYNPAVAGFKDEAGTADNKIKLGDVILVNSSFHTAGGPVRAIVLGIDLHNLYDGFVTLHAFCPRPPGYTGTDVDHIWDAGAPGARNEANYLFKGNLYGLGSEAGTFADAGGTGSRNEANMKFPDGTFADPKGSGSGKA